MHVDRHVHRRAPVHRRNAIYIGGSEALKQKYLVPLAEGRMIGAFALTEVLAGSDSFNLRTRARQEGDEWVMNGEKMWITNGGHRRRGVGVRPHGAGDHGVRRGDEDAGVPGRARRRRRWGSAGA